MNFVVKQPFRSILVYIKKRFMKVKKKNNIFYSYSQTSLTTVDSTVFYENFLARKTRLV